MRHTLTYVNWSSGYDNSKCCRRWHPRGYGDPAYTATDVIFRKGKGIRSPLEKKVDKSMHTPRAGVEDMFNTIGKTFKYFLFKGNFKILNRGDYSVKQELVAATVMLNCFTCLKGCQATALYKLDPPSLEEYFQNANEDNYIDYHISDDESDDDDI